jgi:hypothetical protein
MVTGGKITTQITCMGIKMEITDLIITMCNNTDNMSYNSDLRASVIGKLCNRMDVPLNCCSLTVRCEGN